MMLFLTELHYMANPLTRLFKTLKSGPRCSGSSAALTHYSLIPAATFNDLELVLIFEIHFGLMHIQFVLYFNELFAVELVHTDSI